MGTDCNICSNKCYGVEGLDGSCCTIESRDWIIGPHNDTKEFLERLSTKFGREVKYEDVFIDYEEGSKLFPYKETWRTPSVYPALRVDTSNSRFPCIFYNTAMKACSIYEIRPSVCKSYECSYLKNNT